MSHFKRSIILLIVVFPFSTRIIPAQSSSYYERAAALYDQAAAKCSGPGAACMRQNAAYNRCLAAQYTGGGSCGEAPSCSTACTNSAGAGAKSGTERSSSSENINSAADLAGNLIQQFLNYRADQRAAKEAEREAELEQQQREEEQRQTLEAAQREADAQRIKSEACTTLIEAARLTGGSVDLGGDNACSQAINAELAPLSTYLSDGRAQSSAVPRDSIQLDGTNIPQVLNFSDKTPAPDSDALDKLTAETTPPPPITSPREGAGAEPLSSGNSEQGDSDKNPQNALDELTKETAPGSSGSSSQDSAGSETQGISPPNSSSLDQLAMQTQTSSTGTTTPPAFDQQSAQGSEQMPRPVARIEDWADHGNELHASVEAPDQVNPVAARIVDEVYAAGREQIVKADPDGRALLKMGKTAMDYYDWAKTELPEQSALANRLYNGQATTEDYDSVLLKLRQQMSDSGIVDPVARTLSDANTRAAAEMNDRSLKVLDQTFNAIDESFGADGQRVEANRLGHDTTYWPYFYSVAKNLPLIGKPIEKGVRDYQEWRESVGAP